MEKNFLQRNMKMVVIVGVIVLLALWAVSGFNSFVTMGEKIDGQWAQVENQLQRRFDLLPQLEALVNKSMNQEDQIFLGIAEARKGYSGAVTVEDKVKAATQVEGAIGRLLAVIENYPNLQSAQAVRDVQVSVEGSENRLAVERMNYNNLVRDFNASVKRFPTMILAGIFNVDARSYFEIPEAAKNVPKINSN